MIIFEQTDEFKKWLSGLRDPIGKTRILARLRNAEEHGNFGDCEPVGDGISEMRIHTGPGYRLYYIQRKEIVYLLLMGGNKDTQQRDIKRAKAMAQEL